MAKIKINGDSSGYVEIAAPNAANNNTLEIGSGTKILTNHNLNVGNVGIGTDNPTEKIHVSALGATDEPTIKISGENSSIFLRTAGSGGSFPTGGVGNDGELIYLGGDFRFGVGTASKNLIFFNGAGYTERLRINSAGHTLPGADATQDLGSATKRWANIYSADLQLSNEGAANEVDGTWGNYTIQEGEDDLFLINRRSGKKYKFILQEVN